jgi:hypothetical protein
MRTSLLPSESGEIKTQDLFADMVNEPQALTGRPSCAYRVALSKDIAVRLPRPA